MTFLCTAYRLIFHFAHEVPEEYICTVFHCTVLSCKNGFGAAVIEAAPCIAAAYAIGIPDLSIIFPFDCGIYVNRILTALIIRTPPVHGHGEDVCATPLYLSLIHTSEIIPSQE